MPKIAANGIELYYEQHGEPSNDALLLIHGLGAQITGWPPYFVQGLVDEGFFVTAYDNRDVGYSTSFSEHGMPDLEKMITREHTAPYLISDMAADAAGLVRALNLGPVHVVGVSMGGMIAQQFAIDHPGLTRSLTSIMSTPDPASAGQPTPEALAVLTMPRSENFDDFIIEEIESWRVTGGSGYPVDEIFIREQARAAWDRGRDPEGPARHLAAVVQSPDRRPGLRSVTVPSLVVHGLDDPLVTPSGGDATADALTTAKHVTFPGMGHSLPKELVGQIVAEIGAVARSAA